MSELAREFELLCYGAGWRAELRKRFSCEAEMEEAAEAARLSGRFSLAEFFVHVLVKEKNKLPAYWVRHKLRSEGPMQGWAAAFGAS
jgi:hypothetical protein